MVLSHLSFRLVSLYEVMTDVNCSDRNRFLRSIQLLHTYVPFGFGSWLSDIALVLFY